LTMPLLLSVGFIEIFSKLCSWRIPLYGFCYSGLTH
jgi:hypothetical protein